VLPADVEDQSISSKQRTFVRHAAVDVTAADWRDCVVRSGGSDQRALAAQVREHIAFPGTAVADTVRAWLDVAPEQHRFTNTGPQNARPVGRRRLD